MEPNNTIAIVLIFVTCLLTGQPSQAQNNNHIMVSDSLGHQIDSVFSKYNDPEKPGAAVAVVKNGEIVFKKGYGSANLEYGIATTPSTIFHIASVSKQFTVFAIMLLAERGQLNLDDDVRKYVPEVPDFGYTITLRHLTTHTSGLRDQWNLLCMAGWRLDDVITTKHILKMVTNQKELNFKPGDEYLYCNTGFTLLAEVVARVSNQSFAEFTQSAIFKPLNMTNTLFYDDHEKIVKNRAYSYHSDSLGYKKSVLNYANVGATSLFTTVEDISLWAINFTTPKVGSKNIIDQMNTPAVLNNGKTFGGTYGQFEYNYKGLNGIYHGGGDAGFRTFLVRFPKQNLAVSVFSNYEETIPGMLAFNVADIFLESYFKESSKDAEEAPVNIKFITLDNQELERVCGHYWNEYYTYSRKIYMKDDTLRYHKSKELEYALFPIGNDEFQMLDEDGFDWNVKFKIGKESQTMIASYKNETPIVSQRYTPIEYNVSDLEQFTGRFYSNELQAIYTFIVEDGKLTANHPRLGSFAVDTLGKDIFKCDLWFFETIKFQRDVHNKIVGIKVSSDRVRDLFFEKTE